MTHSTYLHLLVRTVLCLADVKGKGLKLALADQDVGQGRVYKWGRGTGEWVWAEAGDL